MDSVSPVRARIQRRLLLACSDVLVRQRIVTALAGSAVELVTANDREAALATFGRQSFPLVLVDRMLGSVDGLELVRCVRAFSVEAVYVAMLASTTNGAELEHGFCEGVDQYISRDVATPALLERVQAAFKAIELRRASRRSPLGNDVITVNLASGAHTARHLVGRLSAEIKLANSTAKALDILIVGVRSASKDPSSGNEEQLAAALQAVQTAIRPQMDWIACLHPAGRSHRIAVVLPDSPPSAVDVIKQHVRNAFVLSTSRAHTSSELSFGHVTFTAGAGNDLPTALGLLAQAERHQREDTLRSESKAGVTHAPSENSVTV
jgi:DNA-binding response OmpR family regulator